MSKEINSLPVVMDKNLENMIYFIRGMKVMLDRDLAELYEVETRTLNQAIRRNIERFPEDFMFSLTREEIMNLSQIVISSKIKHAPNVFVFTEQGVAMLSSILNSKRAIQVNIQIMRAFVRLREAISHHLDIKQKIEDLEQKYKKHDKQFEEVFQAINNLLEAPEPVNTKELILKGEGQTTEFKSTLRVNLHTMKPDKEIEFAVLKTIAGFLNSEGGTLLIGVNDQGEIIGLKNDNFSSRDKMMLHLTHLIKSHIGVHFHHFIRYSVEKQKNREIFRVDCRKADLPAYLKHDKSKSMYIRTGASTAELPANEIHDYIRSRFHKKK